MSVTFKPPTEPGCSLFIPGPSLYEAPGGDHGYRFDVWLKRPGGRDSLLQTITWTSSLPIALRSGEGNTALASVLLPAMALGLPLRVEAPVSARLLDNLGLFQSIFHMWFPSLRVIPVEAPRAEESSIVAASGTAAFFSGGVDGFHTLRRNLNDVSTLVMLHGYDLDLERTDHRFVVEDYLRTIATELRRDLAVIQTNLRTFSDRYVWWGDMCGIALGAAAYLLEGSVGRMLVASSNTYADFVPCGTNVLTDPLLSTEAMDVVVDGATTPRIDKVFELARWDYARERLRVCWRMPASGLNCGRCNKCLRTMTALWLADALDRSPTFPEPLSPEVIAREPLKPLHAWFAIENRERARALGRADHPIIRAWEQALARCQTGVVPADAGALAADMARDPLSAHWLAEHAGELIGATGRSNPGALLAALERHAPDERTGFFARYRWKAPAALAGRVVRRLAGR